MNTSWLPRWYHKLLYVDMMPTFGATTSGFDLTVAELKYLVTNFGNMNVLPMSGLTVNGTR